MDEQEQKAYDEALRRIEEARQKHATMLDLQSLNLTVLPDELWRVITLRILYLAMNQLTTLSEKIRNLKMLTLLSVSRNKLTTIPSEIGDLKELKTLFLYNNQLKELPRELGKLTHLSALYLEGNPELEIPVELLGPSRREGRDKPVPPKSILNYYFTHIAAKERSGKRPVMEAKVLVLGEASVGKSSLIAAITEGLFDQHYDKTRGIMRKPWKQKIPEVGDLRLNWWDFGGQEIYLSAHTVFLTLRAAYVIVIDERANERQNNLDYWLRMATTFGGGEAPIWVVINKCDQQGKGPDEAAMLRKFAPQLKGFLRTSCKTGDGIDRAKETILQEALKLDGVRTEFAASWFAIKEELEAMKADTLSLGDYAQLCNRHGEPNPTAHEALLQHCDKLGTVRYFATSADSPVVTRETAILNPEWVTLGIFALLDDAGLKQRGGIMTQGQMEEVLCKNNYPQGRYHIIQEVMRRFDLLYDTPDHKPEHHFVMPALLPGDEPKFGWPASKTLEFRYKYESVLPPTLMPAFIARMHRNLAANPGPWRKGCVLELEECRARVIADADAREVGISVSGDRSRCRDALDRIRATFDDLHRPVKKDVLQMIPVPGHPNAPLMDYEFLRTLEWNGEARFPTKGQNPREMISVDIREALDGVRGEEKRREDAQIYNDMRKQTFIGGNVTDSAVGDGNEQRNLQG